ncbi:hypothetical protein GCM10011358_34820 [Sinisalibacter lacisalsi]|uniref:Uncharacterized protein n=1 Tax=Sinisalibacter lacisalsi TaxID=1526570 RepID=A0ABQ1QV98_9RHOB|nr:hypothetical protein GCM10011358_34820 [Sinisalibacter lacisalsi]
MQDERCGPSWVRADTSPSRPVTKERVEKYTGGEGEILDSLLRECRCIYTP